MNKKLKIKKADKPKRDEVLFVRISSCSKAKLKSEAEKHGYATVAEFVNKIIEKL